MGFTERLDKQKKKVEETISLYVPVIKEAGFKKLAEELEKAAKQFV